jgi:hypothetical protein
LLEDRRCSLQCQGTLHLGAKTIIVVIRVPEIRSRDRALQFVANTGPAKIYFQWATHDMFISKYSAEEYYKAVDGPKEEQWYFTNHEFNDAQSCHDRREWRTKELGLHERSPPIHPTPIRPCSRLELPFGRRRSWRPIQSQLKHDRQVGSEIHSFVSRLPIKFNFEQRCRSRYS